MKLRNPLLVPALLVAGLSTLFLHAMPVLSTAGKFAAVIAMIGLASVVLANAFADWISVLDIELDDVHPC